jgi:cytochrome oxidase assembly protein ShyY1
MPRRSLPRPYNELTHLSYAVQWFLFAGILLGGSAALAWSRRRDPASGSEDPR